MLFGNNLSGPCRTLPDKARCFAGLRQDSTPFRESERARGNSDFRLSFSRRSSAHLARARERQQGPLKAINTLSQAHLARARERQP